MVKTEPEEIEKVFVLSLSIDKHMLTIVSRVNVRSISTESLKTNEFNEPKRD